MKLIIVRGELSLAYVSFDDYENLKNKYQKMKI